MKSYSRMGLQVLKGILRVGRDVLIIVLITVALGELGLRIYNSIDPLPIFYSESYNRFRGKPFAPNWNFHLNSKGFNDVEFNTNKTPGTTRILGIGDSFAFGIVPYEYNYLTLVEKYLKQGGHNVELINMGIPGTGPFDYLSLLVHEGFALAPDSVLLSFFIGNDFDERPGSHPRRTLISYSYVASMIGYVLELWKKYEGQIVHGGGGAYDDNATICSFFFYLKSERKRTFISLMYYKSFKRNFGTAMYYISEIKRLCDSRNIRLPIVLLTLAAHSNKSFQTLIIAASRLAPE